MKHILLVGLMMLLPMSASAQVVQATEVEARIQVLTAMVVELQAQLAELFQQEKAKMAAKRDAKDRCEDAEDEMTTASEVLASFDAETKVLQGKVRGTRDSVLAYRAKIDWDRALEHKVLFDEVTKKSEAVADACD